MFSIRRTPWSPPAGNLERKLTEFGVPREKITVSYRGVDVNLFSPLQKDQALCRLGIPEEGKVLLWVGAWSR